MQVEQLTYGSVNRSRMKGYQVIGKSEGIDATTAGVFCQWAPSHNSLEVGSVESPKDAWGLSFFPLSDFRYAIARSVHGAPEYSGRGGLSVVTNAMVMTRKQLLCYEFDAISVVRTALVFGNLILRGDYEENLPCVTLPARSLPFDVPASDFSGIKPPLLPDHAVTWTARECCSLLRDNRKVMIVGPSDPLSILSLIFKQLKPNERSEISFACGLRPSSRRDYRLQFTEQQMCPRLQRDLDRSGIVAIDIARVLVESA